MSLITTLIIILFLGQKTTYDKLMLIEDREQVMEAVEYSTPIKIEVFSKRWGSVIISESKTLRELWSIVEKMSKSTPLEEGRNNYSTADITGTISYLNGKKATFYLGNTLSINNIFYDNMQDKPYVDQLRNYLDEILCSPKNLSALINERNKVTVVDKEGNIRKCGNDDKINIRNTILKFSKIYDSEELQKAIKTKGKLVYHIKIYLEKETNSDLADKQNMYTIVNIDVYENNYIVIQDFANEVVNAIYMKGRLIDTCKKIN